MSHWHRIQTCIIRTASLCLALLGHFGPSPREIPLEELRQSQRGDQVELEPKQLNSDSRSLTQTAIQSRQDPMDSKTLNDLQHIVQEQGWATIETDGTEGSLLRIAKSFGSPVPSRASVPLISRVTPTPTKDARPGTMSSTFGTGAFPLHTDTAHWSTPARYVILRSIGVSHERPTLLARSELLWSTPKNKSLAQRSIWTVRGPAGKFYCSMLFAACRDSGVRLDLCCMHPLNHSARAITYSIQDTPPSDRQTEVRWRLNLALIIDNWKMLHGRGSSSTPDVNARILERVLIAIQ